MSDHMCNNCGKRPGFYDVGSLPLKVCRKCALPMIRRETGIKLSNPLILVWIMLGAVGVKCIIEIIKMF